MSRTYTILALIISITLWLANSANPPNGKTGAPGDGICTECHTNPGNQQGTITIAGLPALIEPNTSYVLTITNALTSGTAALAGMQMTILNSNNQKAGEMSMPTNQAVVTNSGGRQYLEHDPAIAYPGNNMVVWNVTWLSPVTPANTTITAYAAGNVASGSNGNQDDRIVTTQVAGMLNGGGTPLSVQVTSSTNLLCFGGNTGSATATAMGGTPPYTYNWSNGGSGATINNIPAGTYTVTVTDNQAATATDDIVITQPTNLVLQPPTITNVSCNGGNNGSITANPTGGTPPYNYAWSTGSSSQTISNLTAGSYTLVVTDDNNCMKTANYMVTQPASIAINLVNLTHESCAGESDGSITISTTGGVNPLFALWSNGTIGNINSGLEPGSYSVTVTDNNNCTKTASYTINAGAAVSADLLNIHHVTCPGGNDGSIAIAGTGGVPPYTYSWSNGASGPIVSNLTAGNYVVTVIDANVCEAVRLYVINQPPSFNVSINQSGFNICFGDMNADLTAVPMGGNPPFTGQWSNGSSGLMLNNVGSGNYTVTVTDASGCTATDSHFVPEAPQLNILVTTSDETGVGSNDGTANAMPSGGTPGYTYMWSNGSNMSFITGLAPGTYVVTVTDLNGCMATATGQVDAFGCTLDVSTGPDVLICEGNTVSISAAVTGISGAATYLWSSGETNDSIDVGAAGEYCVTVSDNAGCQDIDCVIVTVDIIPPLNCPVTNESVPGANDGAIGCDTMPGIISYLWSNGATTPAIMGLSPGEYCVTVTDASGCTATFCATVQPGGCSIDIAEQIQNPQCAGDTGTITLTLTNALPPVNYIWSNGQQGSTGTGSIVFSVSTAGSPQTATYTVTVTDANGCVLSESFDLIQPLDITVHLDSIKPIDNDGPGFILITVTGGIPLYTYAWTDPQGAQNTIEDQYNLLIPGMYTVTVTDASGCTEEASVTVAMNVSTKPGPRSVPVLVYPVPATDVLYLDLNEPVEQLIIYALDGRRVMQVDRPDANAFYIGDLDAGLYTVSVTDGKRWFIARFVK